MNEQTSGANRDRVLKNLALAAGGDYRTFLQYGAHPRFGDVACKRDLGHVAKKLLDFFAQNMLQLFDSERFLFDQLIPSDRETLKGSNEREKGMASSSSGDSSALGGGDIGTSGRTGQRKDKARQRLADTLRANLLRRKAQQREQKRLKAANMSATTNAETDSAEACVCKSPPTSGVELPKSI